MALPWGSTGSAALVTAVPWPHGTLPQGCKRVRSWWFLAAATIAHSPQGSERQRGLSAASGSTLPSQKAASMTAAEDTVNIIPRFCGR